MEQGESVGLEAVGAAGGSWGWGGVEEDDAVVESSEEVGEG